MDPAEHRATPTSGRPGVTFGRELATSPVMVPYDPDGAIDLLGRSLRWPALWLLVGVAAGVAIGVFTG